MSKKTDTSGDEACHISALREYLTVEYDIEANEVGRLLIKYEHRINVASRFGDKTRDVAKDIMRAEGK